MDENLKKKVDESWKEKAKTEPEAGHTHEGHEAPEPDFKFFLTSLAMQAWIALGAIPNPLTQKTEESLDQAKYIIDTLEILEKKTQGNLNDEEKELMEGLLYELRLGFVNKTTGKPVVPEPPTP